MAGSYRHCVAEDGSFTFDTIENMGDAHEACVEMFEMLNWLAQDSDLLSAEEHATRVERGVASPIPAPVYMRGED